MAVTMFIRADAARGEGHGQPGDQHAKTVGSHDRLPRDLEADGEDAAHLRIDLPRGIVEELADKRRHGVGDADAQQHAQRAGRQVVDHALGHKHLGDLAALYAHGARHADLHPPLGRQHDKDQHDQQQRRQDGEDAKDREDGRENASADVGGGDDGFLVERIDLFKLVEVAHCLPKGRCYVCWQRQVQQPFVHALPRQHLAQCVVVASPARRPSWPPHPAWTSGRC